MIYLLKVQKFLKENLLLEKFDFEFAPLSLLGESTYIVR